MEGAETRRPERPSEAVPVPGSNPELRAANEFAERQGVSSLVRPMCCRPAFLLSLAIAPSLAAAELPELRLRPQTIDAAIQIGYGLAVADVDGDRKHDILLADAKQIAWYRAPHWEKFVIAENLTPRDHVCIAARDLDGDGKAEIAVGAEWNPGDTVGSGAVFLLEAPADRTRTWTARRLPHEPTTHRMAWVQGSDRNYFLAVLPLHGRGNRAGAGAGVRFLAYGWPWTDESRPYPLWSDAPPLHLTHNFDVVPGAGASGAPGPEDLLVAAKEGVRGIPAPESRSVPHLVTTRPAGEVRRGTLRGGTQFLATIEPMHGNELVVYREPSTRFSSGAEWTASRQVLDDALVQGHALGTGDLLGTGGDQIVVGWRGNGRPGDSIGIKLYAPIDREGTRWKQHASIDDGKMACEDLKVADLDGDGRLDIVAAGRATRNVVIYWNETTMSAR